MLISSLVCNWFERLVRYKIRHVSLGSDSFNSSNGVKPWKLPKILDGLED